MTRTPSVIGLGEALIRLSVPRFGRLEHAESFDLSVGGAELNTLIGVAALGGKATFATRLADNPLGRRISAHAAEYGVELVADWDNAARTSLYFVEQGVSPRPSEVLYDREASAMSRLAVDSFAWPALVEDRDIVYATGITCALGDGPAAAVREFFSAALARGGRTAFDLNYRSRLWSWQDATTCLRSLLPSISILFVGARDLHEMFGTDGDPVDLARKVAVDFGTEVVVLRETSKLDGQMISVRVTAITRTEVISGRKCDAMVVDAFGAGDAATAAFLYGLLSEDDLVRTCNMAAWAGAIQHTIPGDAWQFRASDIESMDGTSRRILR